MSTRFSSSGDHIHLHELSPATQGWDILHSYGPSTKSCILSSAWSPDGCCIASTLNNSDKIVMTIIKKNVYTSVETSTGAAAVKRPTVVAFQNHSAKNLVIGNPEKVEKMQYSQCSK